MANRDPPFPVTPELSRRQGQDDDPCTSGRTSTPKPLGVPVPTSQPALVPQPAATAERCATASASPDIERPVPNSTPHTAEPRHQVAVERWTGGNDTQGPTAKTHKRFHPVEGSTTDTRQGPS